MHKQHNLAHPPARSISAEELRKRLAILKRAGVLAKLNTDLLREFAREVGVVHLAAGQALFHKGDLSDAMYVVAKGRLRVHNDGFTFTELGPHQSFGEQSMLHESYRTATATACVPTTLLKLDRGIFRDRLRNNCDFLQGALKSIFSRIVEKDGAEQELSRNREEIRRQRDQIASQRDELFGAQQELEASRARYRALYNLAPVGYITLSAQKRILEANFAAAALLGMARDALVGQSLTGFITPESRGQFVHNQRMLLATRQPRTCELRVMRPDGGTLWARLDGTAGKDLATGAEVCFVTLSDITERKRAEEVLLQSEAALKRSHSDLEAKIAERTAELRFANTELQQRLRQLAHLAAQLTTAEQSERQRLAGLLHDQLQQLLVGARLQVHDLDPGAGKISQLQIDSLTRILTDAIDTARSITRDLAPPLHPCRDLRAALQWLAADVRERHLLSVRVHIAPGLPPVPKAGATLLFTAARELLLNVVKHAGTRQAVLRLGNQSGSIVLEVSDNGSGIVASRLRPSHKPGGFGLISIRERAELLGGRFTLEAKLGRGTRVTLALPLHAQRNRN